MKETPREIFSLLNNSITSGLNYAEHISKNVYIFQLPQISTFGTQRRACIFSVSICNPHLLNITPTYSKSKLY